MGEGRIKEERQEGRIKERQMSLLAVCMEMAAGGVKKNRKRGSELQNCVQCISCTQVCSERERE